MSKSDFHNLDKRWYTASTYAELVQINSDFITGKTTETPYYTGSIEANNTKLIDKLVKLHEYGLLTVGGQESLCEYRTFVTGTPINGDPGKEENKWWLDEEQRGYISFHVQLDKNAQSELVYSLLLQLENLNLIFTYCNLVTGDCISNISEEEKKINLTRERFNKVKELLDSTPWEYPTNINRVPNLDSIIWSLNENANIKRIIRRTGYFTIAMPNYCEAGLEDILLKMCEIAQAKTK